MLAFTYKTLNHDVAEEKMIRDLDLQASSYLLYSDEVQQGPVGRRQGHLFYFKLPYNALWFVSVPDMKYNEVFFFLFLFKTLHP